MRCTADESWSWLLGNAWPVGVAARVFFSGAAEDIQIT